MKEQQRNQEDEIIRYLPTAYSSNELLYATLHKEPTHLDTYSVVYMPALTLETESKPGPMRFEMTYEVRIANIEIN